MAGMDSALFDTFIDNGVQTKCAAGDWCRAHFGASDSFHPCMSCGLKIHSDLLCGCHFKEWIEDINEDGLFQQIMLPPCRQGKYTEFIQGFASSLDICHCCCRNVEQKMSTRGNSPEVNYESDSDDATDDPARDRTRDCVRATRYRGRTIEHAT